MILRNTSQARERSFSLRAGVSRCASGAPNHLFQSFESAKTLENQRFPGVVSYYGYRYYTPQTGRWINRDPIGSSKSDLTQFLDTSFVKLYAEEEVLKTNEFSNGNEYVAMKNSLVNRIDKFGLLCCWYCQTRWETIAVGHIYYPLVPGHRGFGITIYYAKVERCVEKQIGASPCTGLYPPVTKIGILLAASAKPSLLTMLTDIQHDAGKY